MTEAQQVADTVTAIQGNAQALGLTWKLPVGTVVDGKDPNVTMVIMDGDSKPIPAISMIGFLSNLRRVYVIETPKGGLYIVGFTADPESHGILRGERGSVGITFASATSFVQAVVFARPFATPPSVHTNINSGSAATGQWQSRAYIITTTGFNLFLYGPVQAWANQPVVWSAIANP